MWPGKEFAQGMEAQGTGPKGMEAKGTGPKGMEAQGTGPKGMEAQGTRPKGMEAQGTEPKEEWKEEPRFPKRNGKGRPGFFSGIGGRPGFP